MFSEKKHGQPAQKYTVDELLEPLEPTLAFKDDPTLDALYKMSRIAGRTAWVAHEKNYAATHDPLTGLLRKESLKANMEKRLKEGKAFGVFFMDMDAFKVVNDEIGHERGDSLLSEFGAHLLKRFNRRSDALAHEQLIQPGKVEDSEAPEVGRYGGDEFAGTIELVNNGRRENISPDAYMAKEMEYLREVVAEFVEVQPPEIQACDFDVSLGWTIWDPAAGQTTVSELVAQADASMYQDKQHKSRQ